MKLLWTVLAFCVAAGAASMSDAQDGSVVLALKTTTDYPPPPDSNGVVTMTLASTAFIKIKAVDIDYEKTASYRRLVIVKAKSATPMTAKDSGRRYMDIAFNNRFVATAWMDDVDANEVANGFPGYWAALRKSGRISWENFQRLQDGVTLAFANAVLGQDGTLETSSSYGETTTELYKWQAASSDLKIVTAIFTDGKLASKSQFGLR